MSTKPRLLALVVLSVFVIIWLLSLFSPASARPAPQTSPLISPLATPTPVPIYVDRIAPADWAEDVSRHAVLTVHFHTEVDRAQIERGFTIEPPITGTLSWQPQTLMFVAADGWEPGRTYHATVRAADEKIIKRWTFTIRSLVRESVLPYRRLDWNEPITLIFNEPIDHASVEAAFSITPTARGTFVWSYNNTLTFSPRDGWLADTSYAVRLAPTVKTASGEQPLRLPLSWRFATPEERGWLTFGDGPQVQIVSPGGPRTLQYSVQGGLIRPITARLYAISPDDLLARFSPLLQPVSMYDVHTPPITTTGLSLVREWRRPITARWGTSDLQLPTDLPPGLYLLTLDQPVAARVGLIVAYAPDTLIAKQGGDQLSVWAKHLDGGAVANERLRVFNSTGTLLAEGVTDAQGLWFTPLPVGQTPALVIGEHDGTFTLSGLNIDWSQQRRTYWQTPAPNVAKSTLTRAVIYTDRPIYRPGQTVYVNVFARYDNDAIYSRLPLEWDVSVRLRDARNNLIDTRPLHVDEFGALHTSFDLAEGGTLGEYAIEVQVKDDVIRQPFQVEAYRKPDFTVSVQADRTRVVNGRPLIVTIQARTPFGAPVVDAAVTLRPFVRQAQWWYDEAAPQREWVPLDAFEITGRTDDHGQLIASIAPNLYDDLFNGEPLVSTLIEATVTDDSGEAISASTSIDVSDASGRRLSQRAQDQTLTISADRAQYTSGDTAQLTIRAPFSGPALLTIERGRVRRAQVIALVAPTTSVPLYVQDDDAPNVHVVINAYQPITPTSSEDNWLSTAEAKLLIASVDLNVSAAHRQLTVSLTPDRSTYAPRSQATLTIQTTDAAGQPVRSEVMLAVVDETVLALSDLSAPDLFTAFYGPRDNVVQTYDSLRPQRYLPCECGGGGGGENLIGNPRFNLPDTAYWQPAILTDENGHATVTVTLPDSLTRWRIVARAITADEMPLVGEVQTTITTTQAIVIRPILPRTFVQGDRVLLSASIYNNTTLTRTAQVWLEAIDLRLDSTAMQTITLEAKSSTMIGWWAEVTQPDPITITLRATTSRPDRSDRAADAIRIVVPVAPLAVPQVESIVGDLTDHIEQPITLTEDVIVAASTLQIDLAPSIAATMLDGLAYLTGYPYGCVEQTMSKALPNAVVGRALTTLNVSKPPATQDLPKNINAGLQRLYGYQHDDGGWGWWYDDETDDYQTAYVLFGLAMTKQARYTVGEAVIDRGAAYLRQRLPKIDDVRTRVYALYALAISGQGELTTTQSITNTSDLDAFSRAALAIALHTLGDDVGAQRWLAALIKDVTSDGDVAHWNTNVDDDGAYHQKTLASATRSTALALEALVQLAPDDPLVPKVVRWLMARRTVTGWGTTQETAYAVIALTDYLREARELDAHSTYRVYVNEALIQRGTLLARDLQATIRVPGTQLRSGLNRVRLEREGTAQRLYFKITSKVQIGGTVADQAAGPITITRTYLNLTTHRPITMTQVGDLIEVQLTVKVPAESWYVALEDPVPGGLEAVNDRLNTTSFMARRAEYGTMDEEFRYERYGYNQKEIRDDRVVFFITHLQRGTQTIEYLARVMRAGMFNVLPAQAYLMYAPDQWGRSRRDTLTIESMLPSLSAYRAIARFQLTRRDRP